MDQNTRDETRHRETHDTTHVYGPGLVPPSTPNRSVTSETRRSPWEFRNDSSLPLDSTDRVEVPVKVRGRDASEVSVRRVSSSVVDIHR